MSMFSSQLGHATTAAEKVLGKPKKSSGSWASAPARNAAAQSQVQQYGRPGGSFANIGAPPASAGSHGLHPTLAVIVDKIVQESGGTVYVNSGFRTYEEQAQLYNSYKNGTGNLAAKPGSSKHESGLAVDFGGDRATYTRLAAKYGLVATVPGEPWHFELGPEAAQGLDLDNWYQEMGVPLNFGEMNPDGFEPDPEDILLNRLNLITSMVGMDPMIDMNPVNVDEFQSPEQPEGFQEMASFPDSFAGSSENVPTPGWQPKESSGVARWLPVVRQALAYTGQSQGLAPLVLKRMMQESSGNPRATNMWDSNARRGTPSMGLMQVIGPTFNENAGELRGRGPFDPFANLVASFRYATKRYGSLQAAFNRRGGY